VEDHQSNYTKNRVIINLNLGQISTYLDSSKIVDFVCLLS
jgi:hypothetical protein